MASYNTSPPYDWKPEDIVEVRVESHSRFQMVKETLERMGIPSYKKKELYQTCHIFKNEEGRTFITHFKELFGLDGREAKMTVQDIQRRNLIIKLLKEWEMIEVIDEEKIEEVLPIREIKILSHKMKKEWTLLPKYRLKD